MNHRRRDSFSASTVDKLAKRASHCCSNPTCRRATSGPAENSSKAVIIGVAAHITAASPGGPRFDHSVTPEQRAGIDNAIWLCQNCAKLIDADPEKYSVSLLHSWKQQHETWISASITGEWEEPYEEKFSDEHFALLCHMGTHDSLPNPYGDSIMLASLSDYEGAQWDAVRYAASLSHEILQDDDNEGDWTTGEAKQCSDLAGEWEGRWVRGTSTKPAQRWIMGKARLRIKQRWAYIEFHDGHSPYLIVAHISHDRLIGRYVNCSARADCFPWVGIVANNYRIDGFWPHGRWDFRRASNQE